ncbi:beta-ketoacyl-ACP synthase II [Limnochorda pilosa]|uniref:3-oxoacyl-[acyl-carrier-protein] synthase 2 n=1 Tax=Limnochorda pilosa TaxID=1555112 RepID=A0A0K2SK40_LIMPI|nr:beta-ketoacyl-ACP synthase II [Limnochorda pilosa]BAS27465.1 3-oxoacyl-ACP synthase [Limnochorda pilosa]
MGETATAARRVVVTGLGAVTPLGIGVPAYWDGLVSGRSGVGAITRFDASGLPTRIAAEVKGFDPLSYVDRKRARHLDRFAQFAIAAALEARDQSGVRVDERPERVGVVIGSGIGGMETFETQHQNMLERGPDRVSPFFVPMMIANMAAGEVSIELGARGYIDCPVTACATGANAIGEAYRAIARGDADVVFAGGTEAGITPLTVAGFSSARAISTRNEEPERASRPFDRDRDGFVLAEGAAVLVLEELEHARRRNASVLAEIAGYASVADAYHVTAPDPDARGATEALRTVLRQAGCNPDQVGYINAHGTSTVYNDRSETLAIKKAMGDVAYRVAVSSTKSMTGHMLGAAGAAEAIAAVLAMDRGVIPPTINLEHADPECDLDYVPGEAREQAVRVSISNSFGFGGHNVVLLFRTDTL